jgi:Replication-relaxation
VPTGATTVASRPSDCRGEGQPVGVANEVLRFVLWRALAVLAVLASCALVGWTLHGGPGKLLRGDQTLSLQRALGELANALLAPAQLVGEHSPLALAVIGGALVPAALAVTLGRLLARRRRRYARARVEVHRVDHAGAEAVLSFYEALHKQLLQRWWRRLLAGQPSVALELRFEPGGIDAPAGFAWMAITCPVYAVSAAGAALRIAYPNCELTLLERQPALPATVVRLKKDAEFIRRVKSLGRDELEREPPVDKLLTALGVTGARALVQLALTPTPAAFERLARRAYKAHETRLARKHSSVRNRSLVDEVELRGGLDLQYRPLFFADIRIGADDRRTCEQLAAVLRADGAENRLVERGTTLRHRLLSLYGRRIERGEGNPVPSFRKGVYATTELASLWHLPSIDYAAVPFAREALPRAPAPPAIYRPRAGRGTLVDAFGPVAVHPELRRQNTAVPGTVEQGKSSYLIATVAEDLRRECCAVIVLDPKGDAADAAVSLVEPTRTCTFLDFAYPTCGFNPLAVDAPADVIADYVVGALRNLFTDADIRASSDRYLRNSIIAVLAYDRAATLWDAARLLSVGEDGYAYRRAVASRVRELPAFKEIADFFTTELTAQLADARGTTTAKLDAPVNKLARLLNSASIKRVLLNDSLSVDFDRVIAKREVLVVKGALGGMGAGNTSVLMQLLVGMLDAALARQQDLRSEDDRVAVALKVDEAPLVLNRGFADTLALKRSSGLETVACWQADAQWTDREVREQLDALFAHRVYFATASAHDARDAVALTMAEFSDTVRPGVAHLGNLGRPDVRLHLPRHYAIASWTTPTGRQAPFIARTIPLAVDQERIALHASRQAQRGGRHLSDLRQAHWQEDKRRSRRTAASTPIALGGSGQQCDATPALPDHRALGARPRERARFATSPKDRGAPRPSPTMSSESFRELVELDRSQSVRRVGRTSSFVALEPDALDLAMLELIARMRHVLSSQLHRHLNPARAMTTTQRRLKRLSDAGAVDRFQFHRRDGGGVPICYALADRGRQLLLELGRVNFDEADDRAPLNAAPDVGGTLSQARADVHVAGWALALAARAEGDASMLRGPRESVCRPPSRITPHGRAPFGPSDLRLPGGRVPHDFLVAGEYEREVARFDSIRPLATVELRDLAVDLLIERDDRLDGARGAAKLARYDHFLAGWSAHTRRYGDRGEATAVVVNICRSRDRARECARSADSVVRACRAYAGEYPFDWEYPGRERVLFVAERDVHDGSLLAYGVPRLPPSVRVAVAGGDPHAAKASVESRELPH